MNQKNKILINCLINKERIFYSNIIQMDLKKEIKEYIKKYVNN